MNYGMLPNQNRQASGITNAPNDWAEEHEKPRYILDVLLSIVTVRLETMKTINNLPSCPWQIYIWR